MRAASAMNPNRLFLVVGLSLSGVLPLPGAEPVLRLSGIPEQLAFPLPEGSNAVLTATVRDGTARSVWLATSKDAKLKYVFTKTGPNEYQANLAEPEVVATLKTEKGRGRFQVFAELEEGNLLASIGVGYAIRRNPEPGQPRRRVEVVLKGETKQRARVLDDPFGPGDFYVADDVVAIEVVGGQDGPPVRARAGRDIWSFEGEGPEQPLRLKLTDGIRKAWLDACELRVEYRRPEHWQLAATLRPRPSRLDFPGNVVSMIIYQRGSKELPGSHGYLRIELGDITRGQVHVTVRNAESKTVVDTTSVGRGESITFEYGGEQFILYMRDLVNHLIGNDWAVVDLSRIADAELKKIQGLLAKIEASSAKFIREGQEYDGKQAASHLRQKLSEAGPRVKTLDEFIDHIATRSSLTGKPYEVNFPDGTRVPASQWLREEAARPDAKPPKSEP